VSFHLVVSVRFPTGRFSGASNRTAEWPPSPARLCAAVLSVAGLDGRAVVEELFAADPPTIDAPVGYPAIGASRWVPSQYSVACVNGELTPVRAGKERKDETLGRKESAPGQPSVHVGDASLTYTWTGLGHLATPLRPVVQQVPYLGRPTTPVVVTASATGNDPGPVESGRVRFVPDSNGDRRLDVASVDYLRSLDAVHDSRVQNRTIGFDQPVKTRRTAASYRTVRAPTPKGVGRASKRTVLAWVGEQFLYRVADRALVLAGDIQFCTGAVAVALGASEVIPVLWATGPTADGRLKAVIVCDPTVGELPISVQAPTRTGGARLEFTPTDTVAERSLEAWVAERLLAHSPLWTSLTPVNLGADEAATLHGAQPALESAAREPVVGFATHPEPRGKWQPYFPERLSSTHVSVQFADSVPGPLFLQVGDARTALIPAHPGTSDDDPGRGILL